MTRPVTSSKVLLVEDRRVPQAPAPTPVRRYRIARLRLDSRPSGSESPFEYLKRVYD